MVYILHICDLLHMHGIYVTHVAYISTYMQCVYIYILYVWCIHCTYMVWFVKDCFKNRKPVSTLSRVALGKSRNCSVFGFPYLKMR